MVDMIKNDALSLIINTTDGKQAIRDSFLIRREALNHRIAYATTIAAGDAICAAVSFADNESVNSVYSLQEIHEELT